MKWNNIGHELDDFINFYDLDINKDLSVFAYSRTIKRNFEDDLCFYGWKIRKSDI